MLYLCMKNLSVIFPMKQELWENTKKCVYHAKLKKLYFGDFLKFLVSKLLGCLRPPQQPKYSFSVNHFCGPDSANFRSAALRYSFYAARLASKIHQFLGKTMRLLVQF